MTSKHLGIILTIIGTFSLTFSVRIKRQYGEGIDKVLDKLKKENPELIEPTETYIVRKYFWFGLVCIALGSLLQW